MNQNADPDEHRHPIRVVTERTGLSPEVLRAWERRYRAVTPARGDGGHRLYSDREIERLKMLVRATGAGRSVASVVDLPPAELSRLVAEDESQRVARPASGAAHVGLAMEAVADFDPTRLESILRRALLSLGAAQFLATVLAPLLDRIGEEWHAGELTIAHEHAASTVVERLLGWLLHEVLPGDPAPRLLMATPAGERHGIGALMAAAAAAVDGWQITWLGTDLPAAEISSAARRDGPDLVGLSIASGGVRGGMAHEVAAVRKGIPSDTPLLVGGIGAQALPALEGVVPVRDLSHWQALLRTHTPPHLVST